MVVAGVVGGDATEVRKNLKKGIQNDRKTKADEGGRRSEVHFGSVFYMVH
jgi:hypothetical protein